MKSHASELAVGIFVILFGIALFFIAMRVSGLVGSNLSDRYEMSATFDNVNGLKPKFADYECFLTLKENLSDKKLLNFYKLIKNTKRKKTRRKP